MARRTLRERAIVLDRTKLGEQDLILTLLGLGGEQLRAVAKGARKPGGRLAPRSDLFCETDFLLARGRSLDIVTEAELVNGHVGLRGDVSRVAAASALCEAARLTSFEDSPDPFLYPICSRALTACEQAGSEESLDLVVAAYVLKVLAHEGWMPELHACVACGDPDVSRFSATAGGALCASCAKDVAGAVRVSPAELRDLDALVHGTFDQILEMGVGPGEAGELLSLAHLWAVIQLDARMRALEFMLAL